MDTLLSEITDNLLALASYKRLGNLEQEAILCAGLAERHEKVALHLDPASRAKERAKHLHESLVFYCSALEIGNDLKRQQAGLKAKLKLSVCRVLAEGGAFDDFEEFLRKLDGMGQGAALLQAGLVQSKLPGAQIPAILALEEARVLLNRNLESGGVHGLLMLGQCCAELARLWQGNSSVAQGHAEAAISFLQTAKNMTTDPLLLARIHGALAKVFWDCLDDLEGAMALCLSAIDAFRPAQEALKRAEALTYCEQLGLVGCLYRCQGHFASAQINLLLAKDQVMRLVAPFELIHALEREILLTTQRCQQKRPKKLPKDPELDPLTARFLESRDERAVQEALSIWTVRRIDGPRQYLPCLRFDPDFSYFADRKATVSASKLFGSGMNIKPKSGKKKAMPLKRPRLARRERGGVGIRVSRAPATEKDEDEDDEDFIDDDDDQVSDGNDEEESEAILTEDSTDGDQSDKEEPIEVKRSTQVVIVTSDSDSGEDEGADSLSQPFQPSQSTQSTQPSQQYQPFHPTQSTHTPLKSLLSAAPQEFPLMIFDSPVFTPDNQREKENFRPVDECPIDLDADSDDYRFTPSYTQSYTQSHTQRTQKPHSKLSQSHTQHPVKRVTVKFEADSQDPVLLPLSGCITIADLLKKLQGRLDALKQLSPALKIEGVARLPGRARMLPEDLIAEVLVEEDELLVLTGAVTMTSAPTTSTTTIAKTSASSIFTEIEEKKRLLALRQAPAEEVILLREFESRLKLATDRDRLDLSQLHLNSDKWRELSPLIKRFLQSHPRIEKLSLRCNCLSGADLSVLLSPLKAWCSLAVLDAAENLVMECEYRGDWLQSLNLSLNPLRKLRLARIAEVSLFGCPVQLSAGDLTACQSLELGGRNGSHVDSEFLLSLRALKSLTLRQSEFPPSTLSTLTLLPSLESVQLSGCSGLNSKSLCSFVRRCSELRQLKVRACGLAPEEVAEVTQISGRDSATLRDICFEGEEREVETEEDY